LPKPVLGLNGIGGSVATDIARHLAPGATLLTYGGSPFQIPSSLLIDKGLKIEGFSLDSNVNQNVISEAEALVNGSEGLFFGLRFVFLF
jgi:hypothetical protein